MPRTVVQAVGEQKLIEQEIRKSRVRVWVTYLMSVTYAVTAPGLIAWLMLAEQRDLALGVFSGLASTSAAIFAFWFGSRGSARMPPNNGAGGGSTAQDTSGADGARPDDVRVSGDERPSEGAGVENREEVGDERDRGEASHS